MSWNNSEVGSMERLSFSANTRRPVFQAPAEHLTPFTPVDPSKSIGRAYLRFMVKDEPGVIAAVSETLAEAGVSIESFLQKPVENAEGVPIVLTTHAVAESVLKAAIERIADLPAVIDRLAEALADCNESLRLRPGNSNTLASRGFVHLKLGDSKSAIADYDAEIKADPGNPYSLFGRGVGKRQAGDQSGGDADIAAATTIDAGIAESMAKVGVRP